MMTFLYEWLIENEIGLCPALFYRLVNGAKEDLVKKLTDKIDPPQGLPEHTLSLIYEEDLQNKKHTRKAQRLRRIAEFIQDF